MAVQENWATRVDGYRTLEYFQAEQEAFAKMEDHGLHLRKGKWVDDFIGYAADVAVGNPVSISREFENWITQIGLPRANSETMAMVA
jgi:hypothetical protein